MFTRKALGAIAGMMFMTQAAWGADVSSANNEMGMDLLRRLDPGGTKNAFISPFSISEALTLTANGARAATADAMRAALKLKQISISDANSQYKSLGEAFTATGQLKIANGLFVQKSFVLQKSFVATAQSTYGATVQSVDYPSHAAEPVINKWVSDKTNKKIPSIVKDLPDTTQLVIANAVYFKAPWVHEFIQGATAPGPFHATAHDTIQIPLMHTESQYNYASTGKVQVLEMPYGQSPIAMNIILPAPNSSVDAVLKEMSVAWWQNLLLSSFEHHQVKLQLPKFKIEYSASLKNALSAMGMQNAFTGKADFKGIADDPAKPLLISDVLHKTFLDVNEKGTEAAGATAVVMVGAAAPMPQKPVEFKVDRPFIVAIRDTTSGAILFMGVIRDPRK